MANPATTHRTSTRIRGGTPPTISAFSTSGGGWPCRRFCWCSCPARSTRFEPSRSTRRERSCSSSETRGGRRRSTRSSTIAAVATTTTGSIRPSTTCCAAGRWRSVTVEALEKGEPEVIPAAPGMSYQPFGPRSDSRSGQVTRIVRRPRAGARHRRRLPADAERQTADAARLVGQGRTVPRLPDCGRRSAIPVS